MEQRQLGVHVLQDQAAVDPAVDADGPIAWIVPVEALGGHAGRAHPVELKAVLVEDQAHGGAVPQHPGFAGAEGVVHRGRLGGMLVQLIAQVRADVPAGADAVFQLRQGHAHHLVHVLGHLPYLRLGAEDHVGGVHVIEHVELVAPVGIRRAADPDDRQAIGDAGLHEQGGGHVRQRAQEGHVQRTGIVLHGLADDQPRTLGVNGLLGGGQGVGRAVVQHALLGEAHLVEDGLQLGIAALHAVGVAGAVMGGDEAHVVQFGGEQGLHDAELVVSLVLGVGVGDDAHLLLRRDMETVILIDHGGHAPESILSDHVRHGRSNPCQIK